MKGKKKETETLGPYAAGHAGDTAIHRADESRRREERMRNEEIDRQNREGKRKRERGSRKKERHAPQQSSLPRVDILIDHMSRLAFMKQYNLSYRTFRFGCGKPWNKDSKTRKVQWHVQIEIIYLLVERIIIHSISRVLTGYRVVPDSTLALGCSELLTRTLFS